MELEMLKNDLIAVINHYGKTVPIGTLYYVVKDVAREVGDAYDNWITAQKQQPQDGEMPTEEPEPVEGEVEG